MARKDRIPDSDKNLHDWTANYPLPLGAIVTRTGQPAASATSLPVIHPDTKNLKATHISTESDAKIPGTYVMPKASDLNPYQPTLYVLTKRNCVESIAKKFGVDSLNLYWYLARTPSWTILSSKQVRFPFQDHTPTPVGQTIQACEYGTISIIVDDEGWQPKQHR